MLSHHLTHDWQMWDVTGLNNVANFWDIYNFFFKQFFSFGFTISVIFVVNLLSTTSFELIGISSLFLCTKFQCPSFVFDSSQLNIHFIQPLCFLIGNSKPNQKLKHPRLFPFGNVETSTTP